MSDTVASIVFMPLFINWNMSGANVTKTAGEVRCKKILLCYKYYFYLGYATARFQ